MRQVIGLVALVLAAACDPSPQSAPLPIAPIEPLPLGPAGIHIGTDLRHLDQNVFSSRRFTEIIERCQDAATTDECDQRLSDYDDRYPPSLTSLLGRVELDGRRERVTLLFNDAFIIDTIDVNLGEFNQGTYEAVFLALNARYGVNEASDGDYAAYNGSTRGCLVSMNDEATVLLVAEKAPATGWDHHSQSTYFTGGANETLHVIYRSLEANNAVIDALQQHCLPMDASGL